MNQKYVIGLDLGINNVGWSIVNMDTHKIEKCGVRLYSISDTAEERRTSRNSRRVRKRKEYRIQDALSLFEKIAFPKHNTIQTDMLEKRVQGLKNKLTPQEIVNVVCYYMSHRGYIPFGDDKRVLIDLGGLYPCEYYIQQYKNLNKYRAMEDVVDHKDLIKELKDILLCQAKYYPELLKIIGDVSENYGLMWIFSRKRKFWEGPGSEKSFTPFGRFKNENDVLEYQEMKLHNQEKYLFESLIGKCKVCLDERCAPAINIFAEEFNLLNDFINIRVVNIENIKKQDYVSQIPGKDYYKLTTLALEAVLDYCLSNIKSLTYDKVLKNVLGLKKCDIDGYRIKKNGSPDFSLMNTYRKVIKAFIDKDLEYSWLIQNDFKNYNILMNVLSVAPGIVEIKKMMSEVHSFSDEESKVVQELFQSFKKKGDLKYHSLSEKALKKAIADMKSECLNYMQVSHKHDYEKAYREYIVENYGSGEGNLYMSTKFIDEIIASPQVKKTLRQAIRIINAIIKEKGSYPEVIAIESTKEMNSKEKKKEILEEQERNEKYRSEAKKILSECSCDNVTETMVERIMLFNELNGMCPYCGKPININDVLNSTVEIEHILPLSQSANNSFQNKTLSCRKCNASKGNKTPYYFLSEKEFEAFSKRMNSMKISNEKRFNFLFQGDLNKYNIRFFNRNLRDTSYATKELVNQVHWFNEYLNAHLDNIEIKTFSIPGQLTHNIREKWNLYKDRDVGKFHHAVDASIVAATATTPIGKLIIESQNTSQFWILHKDKMKLVPEYLQKFSLKAWKEEISAIDSDDKIKISNQVDKDPNKKISNANVTSFIQKEDGTYYKILQIDNIYASDLMKNEKSNLDILFDENNSKLTLLCQEQNPKLFRYLKNIYFEYQQDNRNPFRNYCVELYDLEDDKDFDYLQYGIKTPSKNNKGVLVKRLRYMQNATEPFLLEKKNICKKDNTLIGLDSVSIYCTRVYWDGDNHKFIFIPVYCPAVDFNIKQVNENHPLYQKYYQKFVAGKNVKFIVDLFNGDFIEIKKSDGTIIERYVVSYHKRLKNVSCRPDNYLSSKDKFTLYDVDVLGNKTG